MGMIRPGEYIGFDLAFMDGDDDDYEIVNGHRVLKDGKRLSRPVTFRDGAPTADRRAIIAAHVGPASHNWTDAQVEASFASLTDAQRETLALRVSEHAAYIRSGEMLNDWRNAPSQGRATALDTVTAARATDPAARVHDAWKGEGEDLNAWRYK